jgi:hypothetical protein
VYTTLLGKAASRTDVRSAPTIVTTAGTEDHREFLAHVLALTNNGCFDVMTVRQKASVYLIRLGENPAACSWRNYGRKYSKQISN